MASNEPKSTVTTSAQDHSGGATPGRPAVLLRAKPSAPAAVHLLLAAGMWTTVGIAMAMCGAGWAWFDGRPALRWALVVAVSLGILKSRFVLDRAARRIAARISSRGDGRCIGGFLSPRSWLLVGVMAAGGSWLRAGHLARPLVGLLYVAVGTALLLSSRILWSRR